MNANLVARWFYAALILALSAWVLHSYVEAMLAACVIAVASWPLYRRFVACRPRWMRRGVASFSFTLMMVLFVLAPLVLAFGALLAEAHALLLGIASADAAGFAVPRWLENVPWLADLWEGRLARPGALRVWTERFDPAILLTGAQSLGQFMLRHLFIIVFTILVLFFLYQEGAGLARDVRRVLRYRIGEQADVYLGVATHAVRASVNSMLVVGLFAGFASGVADALAGVPHPVVWAAITGALSLVPFVGYLAVAALTLQLVLAGAGTQALLTCVLGSLILLLSDKVVRPALARVGTHLPFVWVLIGCLGGFEVLGLAGLVIGPVLLTLARELWAQRLRAVP